jgi:TP901 family phage tail tape measure protein
MAGFTTFSNLLVRSLYDGRQLDKGLSKSQRNIQKFASSASIAGFRLASGFAASFGVISAATFKLGKDFELAFTGIKKTVDAGADFDKIKEDILAMAKATGISAEELSDLARMGGQLGVKAKDISKFTETIAKLSIAAAELTPESAAKGLARLLDLTGEDISTNVEATASTLAFLGDKFATTEERILNFAVTLAGMAKTAGLSSQEVLGISTAFSSVVEGTERASTATQKFITGLVKAVGTGGEELEEFARLSQLGGGVGTGEELKRQLETGGAGEAIVSIIGGLGTLKDANESVFESFDKIGVSNVRMVQSFLAVSNATGRAREAFDAATKSADRLAKLEREFALVQTTVPNHF